MKPTKDRWESPVVFFLGKQSVYLKLVPQQPSELTILMNIFSSE